MGRWRERQGMEEKRREVRERIDRRDDRMGRKQEERKEDERKSKNIKKKEWYLSNNYKYYIQSIYDVFNCSPYPRG